jgi:hypothetical protein
MGQYKIPRDRPKGKGWREGTKPTTIFITTGKNGFRPPPGYTGFESWGGQAYTVDPVTGSIRSRK